jgi:predicted 3-demethylubiquinone-9 3-methyltransferase (glyoxalase superfamily)
MNTKNRGQKITPFLWFVDGKAEEAVNFYISLFKNSKIAGISRYGDAYERKSIDRGIRA